MQMGVLRSIELLSKHQSEELMNEYNYLIQDDIVKKIFKDDHPEIIGLINKTYPLLHSTSYKNQGVYIYFSYLDENDLIKVADSPAKLKRIVEELKKIWTGNEGSAGLIKSPGNIRLYKDIMETITNENAGSDASFWEYFAFRELHINLF